MTSGTHVDAWAAFVPDRGNVIDQLRSGVVEEVKNRGLANLSISTGEMAIADSAFGALIGEKREYIFFQQKLGSSSANATLALRIAPRGAADLELSWRLLESNLTKSTVMGMSQGAAVLLGLWIALCIGLPLLPVGVGVFIIGFGVWIAGMGLGWWKATQNKSPLSADQMLDARVLAQTVDYCLMKQLEKLGVSASELKILQAAQLEGIGRLGTQ